MYCKILLNAVAAAYIIWRTRKQSIRTYVNHWTRLYRVIKTSPACDGKRSVKSSLLQPELIRQNYRYSFFF